MTVSNGDPVDAPTTNSAYVSKKADDTKKARLTLDDPNVAGSKVDNSQKEQLSIASFVGKTINTAYNALPSWAQDYVGSANQTVKARVDSLVARFSGSSGHNHDGTDGEGPQISAANLANFNRYFVAWQKLSKDGVSGSSTDVSTEFSGKSAGGGSSASGVLTTAPNNVVYIVEKNKQTFLEDSEGDRVYGRITESGGTWTLTYYTNEDGTETSYSISSATDIDFIFREVFDQSSRPTIPATPANFDSVDLTGDIVDASASVRGLVNTLAQTFAGVKTFQDKVKHQLAITTEKQDVATSATIAQLSSSNSFVRFTGSTATDLQGIASGDDGQYITLHNSSSAIISVKHQSGSANAADRIITTDGNDIVLEPNQSVEFIYDTAQSRWVVKSGSGSGSGGGALITYGSANSPNSITAAGGISIQDEQRELQYIQGDGGHIDVTANPQITIGSIDGQELILRATDDTQTVKLENQNGLRMNGEWIGANGSVICFILDLDNSEWFEAYRR